MDKIIDPNGATILASRFRHQSKRIVLVGGCFDVLHQGHIAFLKKAKERGDVLFIALESDKNVKRLKGDSRPINDEEKRAKALAQLPFVDYVFILPPFITDLEYFDMTKSIAPHIIAVTANDPNISQKEEQAKMIGGKVAIVTERLKNYSTTQLLQ